MHFIRELLAWPWRVARAVLRGIGRMIVFTWQVCRASWVDVGQGLRPNSLASAAYLFLCAILFAIGLALVLLGFNLADVDRWIYSHTGWWELIGNIIMKMFWGALLLGCLTIAGMGFYDRFYSLYRWIRPETRAVADARPKPEEVGWGLIVTCIVVSYFAVIGLIY
ncbi:MAG: hypothetical protein V4653_07020 [Pseudomonadota bacterium]